ncbi:MAG: GDYXXLXY domain-containing protein, partial [Myxococcales bacterium]|nr:GDYXXLXY domain-containing protein [Myxococcales bacterium]
AADARGLARSGALVIRLDADGVAALVRVDDGRPLADGERRLRYRLRDGDLRLGAESYFFPEGTGDRYEAAAFGELVAVEDGESVLVALRDASRQRLGTPLH